MKPSSDLSWTGPKDSKEDRLWSDRAERPFSTANRVRERLALVIPVIIIAGMCLLGWRLQAGIRAHAFDTYAANDEYLAQAILGPVLEGAPTPFSEELLERIDRVIEQPPFSRDVLVAKVWQTDGTIAYSSRRMQIGRVVMSPSMVRAIEGERVAKFDDPSDPDGAMQSEIDHSLVEVYSPVRDSSGEVVFIAEVYRDGRDLKARLTEDARLIWGTVALTTGLMLMLLFMVASRARLVITAQQHEIRSRMQSLQRLSARNQILKQEAEETRSQAFRNGQEFLSMLGSHLHDGPVQLLSLLVLKMSASKKAAPQSLEQEQSVSLVQMALSELRSIAQGLVLPELDGLSGRCVVELAVRRHRDFTGSDVSLDVEGDIPDALDGAVKVCLFRVIQESLNNAFKHAAGVGQSVGVKADADRVTVVVKDSGGGAGGASEPGAGLGLIGLRRQVRSVSGTIEVTGGEGGGQVVTATLPVTFSPAEEVIEDF